jgi:hypothetical protein
MPIGALLERAKNYIKGSQKTLENRTSAIAGELKEKTRASIDEVLKTPIDPEKKAALDLLYNPRIAKEQKIGVKIINHISRKERIVSGITESGNLILDHYNSNTGEKIREAFPRKILEADQYRIKNTGNLSLNTKSPEKFSLNEVVTFKKTENGKEKQGKIIGKDNQGRMAIVESGKKRKTFVEKEGIKAFDSKPVEKDGRATFTMEEIASGHAKKFFDKSDKKLKKLKNLS